MNKKENPLDLEEIILKCKPMISSRVKMSIGPLNPDWEDIVADIIFNVIENIKRGKFNGDSTIGTYIYTITKRRLVDYIRKKNRMLKYIPETNMSPDPYEHVQEKERVYLLAKSIKKLKPRHADTLYLNYYEGLSKNEIAQVYGISSRRVGVIIDDAMRSLRKIVEKEDIL